MPQPVVPTKKRGSAVENGRSWGPTALLGATRSMTEYEPDDDSSGVECPYCGQDGFKNGRGRNIHIGQSHPEKSEPGTEYECDYCGSTFRRTSSHVSGENKFCGKPCHDHWMAENIAGEDHPLRDRVTVQCTHCGSDLSRKPSHAERNDWHFCDNDCKGSYYSKNIVGENNPLYTSVEVSCDWCGGDVVQNRDRVEQFDRHFCSPGCQGDWYTANLSGKDSWNWNGGEAEYGEGWNRAKRKQIRDRDGRRCQACGRTEAEHLAKRGQKLDVHHIQKARAFDDPTKRNAPSNLVALCIDCHKQWEGIPLQPQLD